MSSQVFDDINRPRFTTVEDRGSVKARVSGESAHLGRHLAKQNFSLHIQHCASDILGINKVHVVHKYKFCNIRMVSGNQY